MRDISSHSVSRRENRPDRIENRKRAHSRNTHDHYRGHNKESRHSNNVNGACSYDGARNHHGDAVGNHSNTVDSRKQDRIDRDARNNDGNHNRRTNQNADSKHKINNNDHRDDRKDEEKHDDRKRDKIGPKGGWNSVYGAVNDLTCGMLAVNWLSEIVDFVLLANVEYYDKEGIREVFNVPPARRGTDWFRVQKIGLTDKFNLLELLPNAESILDWHEIRARFEQDRYAEEILHQNNNKPVLWKLRRMIAEKMKSSNALFEAHFSRISVVNVRNVFAHGVKKNRMPTGRLPFIRRYEDVLKALVKLCPAVRERYDRYKFFNFSIDGINECLLYSFVLPYSLNNNSQSTKQKLSDLIAEIATKDCVFDGSTNRKEELLTRFRAIFAQIECNTNY